MNLDSTQLAGDILAALRTTLADKWPEIHTYGEAEAGKLAQTLVMIETLFVSGQINEAQAALHLQIQRNATRTVLLTVEGLGLLAVEAALDAALGVIRESVNGALGFVLL